MKMKLKMILLCAKWNFFSLRAHLVDSTSIFSITFTRMLRNHFYFSLHQMVHFHIKTRLNRRNKRKCSSEIIVFIQQLVCANFHYFFIPQRVQLSNLFSLLRATISKFNRFWSAFLVSFVAKKYKRNFWKPSDTYFGNWIKLNYFLCFVACENEALSSKIHLCFEYILNHLPWIFCARFKTDLNTVLVDTMWSNSSTNRFCPPNGCYENTICYVYCQHSSADHIFVRQ